MSRFLGSWKSRWPAVALVASLVLNGFLIGLLVTGPLRSRHGPRGRAPSATSFGGSTIACRAKR